LFLWGGAVLSFWQICLKLLALGFIFSYFWCAATAIYYLLRKDEDGTEMTEVTYEEGGEARGMPPLSTDTMGVPSVRDNPPPSGTTAAPTGGETPPPVA
jgi:hypothetical protein